MVAQGYKQEERIDYAEVFAPVARIEAIRLFLAYASFKDFVVYQMDVKSAFLYGKIEEEVYVCQPPGFEDPDFPDRVYKVEKVLYKLHQAPRAWYETLSTYLLDNGFQRGKIDKTLFIKRHKGDIYLVQVYVDNIIFGSTKKKLCIAFEKLKHEKFQMSSMGELTFFLGLQVQQKKDGIFIKAELCGCFKLQWTSASDQNQLLEAKTINGEAHLHALVDGKKIIINESSVRRDLQLADEEGIDCLPNSTIFEQLALMGPKTTAWNEFSSTMASAIICLATNQKFNFLKLIFDSMIRNLDNVSGKILMYPRFVQIFLDQQLEGMSTHKRIYIAPSHTKKIFRNMRRMDKDFSGRVTPLFPTMVVQNQSQMGEGLSNPTDPHHTPTFIQPSPQPQKTQKPRKHKRKDTQVPQPSDPTESVADEAVHKELGDSLVRATTTAYSLEAEHDSGNINKTRSKVTPNESSSQGTNSGGVTPPNGAWTEYVSRGVTS
ncbi:putative ribonuclease H-like domain-containing protein [Tanacetum coccineum]